MQTTQYLEKKFSVFSRSIYNENTATAFVFWMVHSGLYLFYTLMFMMTLVTNLNYKFPSTLQPLKSFMSLTA